VNTWKPILAALVIFAAGVVTGGLTVNLRQPPLPPRTSAAVKNNFPMPREGQLRDLLRRMQNQLDLTSEQRGHIEAILHDSQQRMKVVWDQVGPTIREEFRDMRQKIRSELTPEQRKKFEHIMKQHDERNKPPSRNDQPAAPSTVKPE